MEAELTSPSEAWSPSDTAPILPNQQKNSNVTQSQSRSQNAWEDSEFEPIEETFGSNNSKLEEARKKREERKLMRQKELEARKASRAVGGPMKLGAKRL